MPKIAEIDIPDDFFDLFVRKKAVDYVRHMHEFLEIEIIPQLHTKLNNLFPQEHNYGISEHLFAIIRVQNSDYFTTSAKIEASETYRSIVKEAQKHGIVLVQEIINADVLLISMASYFNTLMKQMNDPQYDF